MAGQFVSGWATNFSVNPGGHRVVFNCRDDWRAGIWAIDGLLEEIRKALERREQ